MDQTQGQLAFRCDRHNLSLDGSEGGRSQFGTGAEVNQTTVAIDFYASHKSEVDTNQSVETQNNPAISDRVVLINCDREGLTKFDEHWLRTCRCGLVIRHTKRKATAKSRGRINAWIHHPASSPEPAPSVIDFLYQLSVGDFNPDRLVEYLAGSSLPGNHLAISHSGRALFKMTPVFLSDWGAAAAACGLAFFGVLLSLGFESTTSD